MAQIRYITLDQLMSSVESDMSTYADEGMINRGIAIKVVRKVNEDLGLKINKERHTVIEIKNHKADLPADFQYLQVAMMSGMKQYYHTNAGENLGTLTEEHTAPILTPVTSVCDPLAAGQLDNQCGGKLYVVQRYQERIVEHRDMRPVRLMPTSRKFCTPESHHNWFNEAGYEIDIEDGFITTSFKEGDLYLSYLTDMTDEDGNVLVLDHPLLTEYYEYAVKKQLLENWMLNTNADVVNKLAYIKQELNEARLRALNFVNTIEYSQIKDFYQQNRFQFARKYYSMFSDYDRHGRYPLYPAAYA